ncbi:MAG: chromosomal replication initiator protein DnaA [Fimbriimonadaceae bacterium]|nr:chromosomal replication initiator protein DnaA [Fimbriimonadaceae bacterium]
MAPKMAERFLHRIRPAELRDGVAILEVPNSFNVEWIRSRCLSDLQRAISEELGETVLVELRINATARRPEVTAITELRAQPVVVERSARCSFEPGDRYRFDNFVTGQSNRLAFAGAKAVASDPGKKYNPLFIYGPSGLGKTHLLHSIAREVLQRDPNFPVVYISAQQFAEELISSLQQGKIEPFRRAQRSVGIWLVDDIQFIAGKDRTQEELFYTFNHLHQTGKQIVLCSDRPPRELHLMDERLRSRFESGLVADIQWPDTETRSAILLNKAHEEGVPLTTQVALYLAEHVPGNIRNLEGAMTKLAVQSSLNNHEISMDLAQEMVELHYSKAALARPSFTQILDVVSKFYRIPVEDIRGTSRKAPIALARHVAVYLTREVTQGSWKHIGHQFGDRDHTSMMHAYEKISKMAGGDRDFANVVRSLLRNLNPDGQ